MTNAFKHGLGGGEDLLVKRHRLINVEALDIAQTTDSGLVETAADEGDRELKILPADIEPMKRRIVVAEHPKEGDFVPHGVGDQGLAGAEKALCLGERERLRAGERGVFGKLAGEPGVEVADAPVERLKLRPHPGFRRRVALIGRLANRLYETCIEALPLLNGVLVGPDGPRQRVIAGREARAHAGDRASRAGGLGELPDFESFGKQFCVSLRLPFDDDLDDLDVAQKDETYV